MPATDIRMCVDRFVNQARRLIAHDEESRADRDCGAFLQFIGEAKARLAAARGGTLCEFARFLKAAESCIAGGDEADYNGFKALVERANELVEARLAVCMSELRQAVGPHDVPDMSLDPFECLGIKAAEDPISDGLAWLLDPDKPHGLGTGFLAAFLKEACRLCGERFEDLTLENIRVSREKALGKGAYIDIEICGSNFLCGVEAKVRCREGMDDITHKKQTCRYAECYEGRLARAGDVGKKTLLLLYLVPVDRKGEPSSRRFRTITYGAILPLLEGEAQRGDLPEEVRYFLRAFAFHIRKHVYRHALPILQEYDGGDYHAVRLLERVEQVLNTEAAGGEEDGR